MFHVKQESGDNVPLNGVEKVFDPFVLPVQPISAPLQCPLNHAAAFSFPFLKCTTPTTGYPFHPGSGPSEMHWQTMKSKMNKQEKVLTPTNAEDSIFDAGLTAATPEFVHPRNLNVPQWLMSPPMGDQDPGVASHSSIPDDTAAHVSECLLTPEDFVLRDDHNEIAQHSCNRFERSQLDGLHTPNDFVLHLNKLATHVKGCTLASTVAHTGFNTHNRPVNLFPGPGCQSSPTSLTNCTDSGISTPVKNCSSVIQSKNEVFMRTIYSLSKRCKSFVDFRHEMTELYPHHICDAVLSLLLEFSMSRNDLHNHLLNKIAAENPNSVADGKKSQKCPIAVFWDIENCQVPCGKSALSIVQKIRKTFFKANHSEEEFMVVCDIHKESKNVVQDLNNAQVNVVHVNATAKNAADDKLRQSIRRYAHSHKAPATVILITGDCNFTSEVSDLRHRHKFFVVLIHKVISSEALIQSASSAVPYEEFVDGLPTVYPGKGDSADVQLLITNLPPTDDHSLIRTRLKSLSFNCGGKVMHVTPPTATMKFSTKDLAKRALKRLAGEDVCGRKISVQFNGSNLSAFSKHFTPRHRQHKVQHRHPASQVAREYSSSDSAKPSPVSPLSKDVKEGVRLTISNIDSQLGVKAIQETILSLVSESCAVWQLLIRPHNRFTVMCDVTVPNVNAALRVLLQLHRRKVGGKRVLVTISQHPSPPAQLRNELLFLLRDLDHDGIHISNLSSLYMHNYHKELILDELRGLDDFEVNEREEGTFISIKKGCEIAYVCQKHFRQNTLRHVDTKIEMRLREFSAKLHALLHLHCGVLHLQGFESCYEAEFGSFPYPERGQGGVYLEHEISYVPGVRIVDGIAKTIVWSQPHSGSGSDTASDASSRLSASTLVSFTKELVDLLKTCRYCCMPLDDFKAKYQLHFGRPFHVEGCSGLHDALVALPHVVQVMGSRDSRLITLTHRAQVKRFTQEIVKVLKTAPDRAILVAQLPEMYFRTLSRPWSVYDFGVCVLSDLLDDIPDGNICVSGEGDNIVLSLPTKDRSVDEVMRTTQFSRELIEILRTQVRFRMRFTDFVPAYHRHFGRQCKLARYGFTKLLDLFESLPRVVQVKDELADKFLQLSDEERLKVLTSQILGIIRKPSSESEVGQHRGVLLHRLQSIYLRKYGFPLVPKEYNCSTVEAVVRTLSHAVKIAHEEGGPVLRPAERKPIRLLGAQLLVLLLDIGSDSVGWRELHQAYQDRYKEEVTATEFGFISIEDVIKKALSGIAKFESSGGNLLLHVKPIYTRAKRIRAVLLEHGGTMSLGDFNRSYRAQYGDPLDAERHGFRSVEAMMRALTSVLVVKGFGIKKTLALRNHMQYGPLSSSLPIVEKLPRQGEPAASVKPRPLREIISSGTTASRMNRPGAFPHATEARPQLFPLPSHNDPDDRPSATPQYVCTSGIELYHRYQSIIPSPSFKPTWPPTTGGLRNGDTYSAPPFVGRYEPSPPNQTTPPTGPSCLLSSSPDSLRSADGDGRLQLGEDHGYRMPPSGNLLLNPPSSM